MASGCKVGLGIEPGWVIILSRSPSADRAGLLDDATTVK